MPFVTRPDGLKIYYETHGSGGPALFCGAPLSATPSAPGFEEMHRTVTRGFIDGLGRDYRLLLMDYPYGCGLSSAAPAPPVTSVERVAEDILAVADAARFARFAWYGFSWGAVTGLQLALRTDRLTALVAGGFPPLDGPNALMLETCQRVAAHPSPGFAPEYMKQFVRYYEDLRDYDDHAAVPQIKIPCMTFVGDRDEIDMGNIARNRVRLEALDWQVHILRGEDHGTAMQPNKVIPLIRGFLDPILLRAS